MRPSPPRAVLLLLLLAGGLASAQLELRGEVEVAALPALTSAAGRPLGAVGLALRAHLEAGLELRPVELRAVLDPEARLAAGPPGAARVAPGLTEAFARVRLRDADLSLGLERLPLETARLSVPFRLEPVGETGRPRGLPGVRAVVAQGRWRLRPALVYRVRDDRLGGVLSVRREFADFELEAHAAWLGRAAVGLGGSGLVGDLVLYGEAWVLTGPWDGRGALGLSGFAGDALWTVEAAYAPARAGGDVALPQLLGQVGWPLDEALSLELAAGLARAPAAASATGRAALRATGSVQLVALASDHQAALGLLVGHDERATTYGLRLGVTAYF